MLQKIRSLFQPRQRLSGSRVLDKAAYDYWEYAIGTTSGVVFEFAELTINGEWCHLKGITHVANVPIDFEFGRGVDLRLSQIAWIADGGHE